MQVASQQSVLTPAQKMTNPSSLADRLASPTLSSKHIEDGLRVLGFRSSTIGLKKVLGISSALRPYFERLYGIFPEAGKILTDFQRSGEILQLLESTRPPIGEGSVRRERIATLFYINLAHEDFPQATVDEFPAIAEIISFFWLVFAAINARPGIIISNDLARLLEFSTRFILLSLIDAEDEPHKVHARKITWDNGVEKWLDSTIPVFTQMSWCPLEPERVHNGFKDAVDLLRQLDSLAHSRLPSNEGELDTSPVSCQRGAKLTERERLGTHHNAIEIHELQTLAKEIRRNIEPDISDVDALASDARSDIGAPTQYFFESVIIALAITTGRTIQGALQLRIGGESAEHIKLDLFYGHQSQYYYPIWNRKISSTKNIQLPLPSFLKCLSGRAFLGQTASCIEDCLPYTLVPWEDRCIQWLQKFIPTTAAKINRRLRDALPRSLYQISANSALLEWITSPLDQPVREPESLSHYLNPHNSKTVENFGAACTKLFNKYGAPKEIRDSFTREGEILRIGEQRRIAGLFLADLSRAETSANLIEYHNALARYVVMLLIVATGHRKSQSPFFFPWDILIGDKLAFLCDKQAIGSEARFVPVPEWVEKLVVDYRKHLVSLAENLCASNPGLSEKILEAASLKSNVIDSKDSHNDTTTSEASSAIGHFFFIDQNSNLRTLSTRDLEIFYSADAKNGIRIFRKSIADYLWSQDLSGHQIAALLGHNSELHAFGESSAWSIMEWADQVRPKQEAYLALNGWKTIHIAYSKNVGENDITVTPSLERSHSSYEGRGTSNDHARSTARKLIRELIPPEWFNDENAQITDKDISQLKDAAKQALTFDPEGCEKLNYAISKELAPLRRLKGIKLASSLVNMTRTEPGPISLLSARHYAISKFIRSWWIGELGHYASDPKQNYIDRLAAIGISLIIFDAVLDRDSWTSLLTAIACNEVRVKDGCVTIRATVENSTKIFDKLVTVTPYTAAQIVGFNHIHHKVPPDEITIDSITKRITHWLKRARYLGGTTSIHQLRSVFSAWWLPRLAGAENAIAKGDHSGPGPDLLSECALYGVNASESSGSPPSSLIKSISSPGKLKPSYAKRLINLLLNEADGKFERKEQTSRSQRMRLSSLLQNTHMHTELMQYEAQKEIVSVMLNFIQYLFDEGGIRVDLYRFNSIRTHYSNITDLIDELWDQNLCDMESEDFNAMYERLLEKSNQRAFAIWYFHKFLKETYGAANSAIAMRYQRAKSRIRPSLITTGQFNRAWTALSKEEDDGQLIFHAKTYLSICYQYGLRSKETLGATRKHILNQNPFKVRVEKNNARDLKVYKPSLRVVDPLLADTPYQKHLSGLVKQCELAQQNDTSLFSDAEKKDELYNKSRISQAVTISLRTSTGNMSIVPHSMRHTAATRLAHFALSSPRAIPLSTQLEDSLKGKLTRDSIYAIFDGGFYVWPFWLDRVSIFLGHTSVDTLLNTYFHSSHIHLAERTWHATSDIELTVKAIASMLGVDRTAVGRKLHEISSMENGQGFNSKYERLIAYYADKSRLHKLGSEFSTNKISKAATNSNDDTSSQNLWISLDRLLCARLDQSLSFSETQELTTSLNLAKKFASEFVDAYKQLVKKTGFDDFEPINSEILVGPASRNAGTKRGSTERERGISAAQRLVNESPTFLEKLVRFCRIWSERVNAKAPWFVAHDAVELMLIIDVLTALGVTRDQFEFGLHNHNGSDLKPVLKQPEIDSAFVSKKRFSVGHSNVRVSEIGLRVSQKKEGKIGDYRDTHRLAFVLSAIKEALNR